MRSSSRTRDRSSTASCSRLASCSRVRARSARICAVSVPPAVPGRSTPVPVLRLPLRGGTSSSRESSRDAPGAGARPAGAAAPPSATRVGARLACHASFCAAISAAASATAIARASAAEGMRSTAPRRNWLALPPTKASGLARTMASIIWLSVISAPGRAAEATSHKVSPAATGPYSPGPEGATTAADGAGSDGAGSDAGSAVAPDAGSGASAAGASAGVAAGASAAASTGAAAGASLRLGGSGSGAGKGAASRTGSTTVRLPITAGATTGGSSNTVYSRSNRPFGQVTSTRKLRKGSRTGDSLVTRMVVRPSPSSTTSNASGTLTPERSSPTREKSCAEASFAMSPSASSGVPSLTTISATSGSLSPDFTLMPPRPSAQAFGLPSPNSRAIASGRLVGCFIGSRPLRQIWIEDRTRRPESSKRAYNTWLSCGQPTIYSNREAQPPGKSADPMPGL